MTADDTAVFIRLNRKHLLGKLKTTWAATCTNTAKGAFILIDGNPTHRQSPDLVDKK
jgi:hypothetical protein